VQAVLTRLRALARPAWKKWKGGRAVVSVAEICTD